MAISKKLGELYSVNHPLNLQRDLDYGQIVTLLRIIAYICEDYYRKGFNHGKDLPIKYFRNLGSLELINECICHGDPTISPIQSTKIDNVSLNIKTYNETKIIPNFIECLSEAIISIVKIKYNIINNKLDNFNKMDNTMHLDLSEYINCTSFDYLINEYEDLIKNVLNIDFIYDINDEVKGEKCVFAS